MRGANTVAALMQAIGREYMAEFPEVGLPLLGGGTARGYKSVLDGTVDIGMASGEMPEELQRWARKHGRQVDKSAVWRCPMPSGCGRWRTRTGG